MPNGDMSTYTKPQRDAIVASFISGGRNAPPAPNARSFNSAMDALVNNPQKVMEISKNLGFTSPDGDMEQGDTDNGADDQLNVMMGQPAPIVSNELPPPSNQAPVVQQSAPKQLPPINNMDQMLDGMVGNGATGDYAQPVTTPMQAPQSNDSNGTVEAILAALGIGGAAYGANKLMSQGQPTPVSGEPPMTNIVPEQKMLPAPNKQLEYKPQPASPRKQIAAPSGSGEPPIPLPKPKVRVKAGGTSDIVKTLAGKAGRMIR